MTSVLALAIARQAACDGSARSLRQRANVTLAEIAAECKVSRSTINAWETGARRPSGAPAVKYAHILRELEDRFGS